MAGKGGEKTEDKKVKKEKNRKKKKRKKRERKREKRGWLGAEDDNIAFGDSVSRLATPKRETGHQ